MGLRWAGVDDTPGERLANSLTHGVGLLLALAGASILVVAASRRGTAWHVVSCSVFGATLVLLYAASTLYHSIPFPRARAVLRVLDHTAIYLLIAGTYTPFTLVNLRGAWGWALFGTVWALAAMAIAIRTAARRPHPLVSMVLYVSMGWVALVAARPVFTLVEPGGFVLLLAGGVAYTAGIAFYAWHRLPYHHAIWHVFVLAGSICHFFAVLFYVI